MARYYLRGGPCHNLFRELATRPKIGSEVTCGGDAYIFDASGNYVDAGSTDFGKVPPGTPDITPAGGPGALNAKQIGRAWHKLTHALAVDGPRSLRKTRAAGKRARRAVR